MAQTAPKNQCNDREACTDNNSENTSSAEILWEADFTENVLLLSINR